MKIIIPNPGFYESIFSYVLDFAYKQEVEYLQEYEDMNQEEAEQGACEMYSKENHNNMARAYVDLFQGWLKDDMGLDISLTFSRIISPLFYNFASNNIEVELTEEDASTLYNALIACDDVREVITYVGTPRDGYLPCYSPDWQDEHWQLDNLSPCQWEVMLMPFYEASMKDDSRYYQIEVAAQQAIVD